MINTELAKVTHTTVADQSARYPISFKYDVLPDTLAPELLVTLDGNPLTYGTDYTIDAAGLQLVNAPEANKTLMIKRDVAFTQEMDFQTGLIDPDQIEDGFDRTVMRDQELKQNVLDVAAALAAETEERITADTLLQDAIDTKQDIIADLATIRSGAAAGATAVQPGDLETVATTGSYNDLNNRPTIPTVGDGLVTIKQGGVVKASFSVNQDTDVEVELEQGGGSGAVSSVNGKTGAVVLDASDVGAATAAQGSKADTAVQPAAIANMQMTSNLVTSVSSASTDTQYPSAKLFYDTCGDIESLINAL